MMHNLSIQSKIIFGVVLFTIFIVGLERYSLSEDVIKQFIESKQSKNHLLINTISPVVGLNIALGLSDANKDYLDAIAEQNRDLAHLELTDMSGNVIYNYTNKSEDLSNIDKNKMNFSTKTIIDNITDKELAVINLHFLNNEYELVLNKNRETTLKIFAVTIFLLGIFILAIKREFRHLESLSENVLNYNPAINNFKLTHSDRKDEVGIVHNAILSMVKKIEEHSNSLDEINALLEEKVKLRTQELEHINDEFKNMLNNTIEGIGIFKNNRCINLNKAALDIFEYVDYAELLGKTPLVFVAPEAHERTIEKVKSASSEIYESVGIKSDGTKFPILLKGKTFITDGATYRITSIMDLTKIKENERLLELAKEKAEASTKVKSDFLANMSHEIRTPMNGIIGMTHLVKQTKLDAKQMSYLTKIETASNNLLNIINDILDFSKAEAGKLNIEHIDFDMNDVIYNVKNLIEYKAKEKKLNFNIFYSDENSMFYGDQLRISQILINLLNNAIKFTETGSVELYIETLDEDMVKFTVKDTGIGLTPEQQSKLFKSFSQADDSITRKYGGTGLGLSISKQLVELMDGKIWVESEIGKGSKFIFELKLSKGNVKKLKQYSIKNLEKLKNDINNTKHSNILLVEDNKTNQAVIIGVLEDLNIDIDIANNGQEAIELYQINSNKYNLIFMDIQMPIIDGISATKIIREIDKKIPIVALTANIMKGDIENIKLAGMNEYLSKPIEVEKLYKTLLKYLSKN